MLFVLLIYFDGRIFVPAFVRENYEWCVLLEYAASFIIVGKCDSEVL